ncbi:hypothetical protein AGLY_013520 [Aphis glycines]|uniref:Uncharacterized protein n=1 Tax=Aphis glycines TaxID=307491 RepID=A0A6G0T7V1_APHGL|nr:hypothetical protein AGLY_013520 [Aphis glycines]
MFYQIHHNLLYMQHFPLKLLLFFLNCLQDTMIAIHIEISGPYCDCFEVWYIRHWWYKSPNTVTIMKIYTQIIPATSESESQTSYPFVVVKYKSVKRGLSSFGQAKTLKPPQSICTSKSLFCSLVLNQLENAPDVVMFFTVTNRSIRASPLKSPGTTDVIWCLLNLHLVCVPGFKKGSTLEPNIISMERP